MLSASWSHSSCHQSHLRFIHVEPIVQWCLCPFSTLFCPWFRLPASAAGDVSVDGRTKRKVRADASRREVPVWDDALRTSAGQARSPPRVPYTGSDDRLKILRRAWRVSQEQPGTLRRISSTTARDRSRKVDHRPNLRYFVYS